MDWRDLLPVHHNALAEDTKTGERLELGFFADEGREPLLHAGYFVLTGKLRFAKATVYDDGNLGNCVVEIVSRDRYLTVKHRMNTYTTTWRDRFHLMDKKLGRYGYGTCETWATSVLWPET